MHFTLTSDEGLLIRGALDAPADPRVLVVLVHGFKGFMDWGFFPWLAEELVGRGMAVCRFNMSRGGIGDDPESFDRLDLFEGDTYSGQVRDLLAAVAFAQSHHDLPTFLLGHSRGGGVALLAADRVSRLHGVVTWSAISRADRWSDAEKAAWRRDGFREEVNARTKQTMRMSTRILEDCEANAEALDIGAAAARLRAPLLAMHGGRDESVPLAELDAITSAAPDATRVVIGNASHTYNAIHPLVHVPNELRLAATLSAHFIGAYLVR